MINASRVILLVLVLAAAGLPSQAAAPPDDNQGYLREVVKEFTFEEPHADALPMNWVKFKGRSNGHAHPSYTRGSFDREVYHGAHTSFRFDMEGGDCLYEYDARRIVINSAFDYALEGWIKTEGLKASRARLSVWFNDEQGRQIPDSKVDSVPLGGTRDWTRVEIFIAPTADRQGHPFAMPPRFADLAMEVAGQDAQDIGAKVWFDDVRLYRIPRLSMKITSRSLFFNQGDPVVVHLAADGLLAGAFPGRFQVDNDRGEPVVKQTAPLVPDPQGVATLDLKLPPLPPGVYHVRYGLPGSAASALRREATFAVMSPRRSPEYLVGRGFGVADISGLANPERLSEILGALGVGAVKIPVWTPASSAEEIQLGNPLTERLLQTLNYKGVQFIGVFGQPPPYLVAKAGEPVRGATDFFALKEDAWQQAVGFTMSRYAGVINSWQLGDDDDPSVVRLQLEPKLLDPAMKQMDRLTASVPLGIPWPALYALPSKMPSKLGFVSLRIGTEIAPEQIQEYLRGVSPSSRAPVERPKAPGAVDSKAPSAANPAGQPAGGGSPKIYLTLDPLDRDSADPEARILDFVSRVLAAKRAGVEEIFFHKLIDPRIGLLRRADQPTELFLVARTLTDMLGGSHFAGWLPLEREASAMVFERADGSETLVVWKEDLKKPVQEPLYLGENLVQTDLWGRQTPLPRFGPVTSLTLQALPVFVTGIDPQITGTRRSFQLRGGAIPAAYRRHQATVEFTNKFKHSISGQLRLRPPAGWSVDPSIVRFNLAADERFELPVTITVPYNETVGQKEILADFDVDAKIAYKFLGVAPVRFEMATARTTAVAFVENGQLIIEQEIICTVKEPQTFSAYAQIPGRPMQSYSLARMKPGESVVKRYVIPYTPSLEGKQALVGVRDDTTDRGFANVLLPLANLHLTSQASAAAGSSARAAIQKRPADL